MKQVKVILKRPVCIDNVWYKIGEELIIDFETLQQGTLSNCFNVVNEQVVDEIIKENSNKSEKESLINENKSLNDDEIVENLCNIDHITIDIAHKLLELGIRSADDIVKNQSLLTRIKNYKKIIESAKDWMEE